MFSARKTTQEMDGGSRGRISVQRSSSARIPFLKLGDGFLKTFRNIKRK